MSRGFNRDMIVEKTAPVTGLQNRVDATMDGGTTTIRDYTWYEAGFNPNAPTTGLPVAGSSFTVGGTNTFTMPASYVGNNALYIANFGNYTAGTLALEHSCGLHGLVLPDVSPAMDQWW